MVIHGFVWNLVLLLLKKKVKENGTQVKNHRIIEQNHSVEDFFGCEEHCNIMSITETAS